MEAKANTSPVTLEEIVTAARRLVDLIESRLNTTRDRDPRLRADLTALGSVTRNYAELIDTTL
jgi:hypothetical protein